MTFGIYSFTFVVFLKERWVSSSFTYYFSTLGLSFLIEFCLPGLHLEEFVNPSLSYRLLILMLLNLLSSDPSEKAWWGVAFLFLLNIPKNDSLGIYTSYLYILRGRDCWVIIGSCSLFCFSKSLDFNGVDLKN